MEVENLLVSCILDKYVIISVVIAYYFCAVNKSKITPA